MEKERRAISDTSAKDDPDAHTWRKETVQETHAKNLQALRDSNKTGGWNNTANKTAYFAGRGFAAKAIDGTKEEIMDAMVIAANPDDCNEGRDLEATLNSGWNKGILKPLKIVEDEFPEATKCLEEFNSQFYVVEHLGSKVRVCWETTDSETGSLNVVHQSFEDFGKRFMHQQIQVGESKSTSGKGENKKVVVEPIYKDKAQFWLYHKDRRQFHHIEYAPETKLPPNVRNLWRGFAVTPEKGNCDLWLEHVFTNICKGNQEKYDWLLRWMAWKLRHPGEKSFTCPVLTGPEGIGKNICFDAFTYLWGPHALQVTKREHILGKFNFHFLGCSVMVLNEAIWAGDRAGESTLKGLITDPSFMLEGKGLNAEPHKNILSIAIISNESWAVPASISARRFTVLDCGEAKRNDTEYFGRIQDQLKGIYNSRIGYKALLYHLTREVKLRDFDPRSIVRTEALANQQAESLRGAEAIWHDILFRGELPGGLPGNVVQSERLLTWARLQHNRNYERVTDKQLSQVLGKSGAGVNAGMEFGHAKPRPVINGRQVHAWQIPSLRNARATWDEKRFRENWPELQAMQGTMAGKPEVDPDDWVLGRVGDEKSPQEPEVSKVKESEPIPVRKEPDEPGNRTGRHPR